MHVVHEWPDVATRRSHPLVVQAEREEGYHDDNQHAPDENLRIGNLLDGVVALAALLTG